VEATYEFSGLMTRCGWFWLFRRLGGCRRLWCRGIIRGRCLSRLVRVPEQPFFVAVPSRLDYRDRGGRRFGGMRLFGINLFALVYPAAIVGAVPLASLESYRRTVSGPGESGEDRRRHTRRKSTGPSSVPRLRLTWMTSGGRVAMAIGPGGTGLSA
jgi:hypothetical protein